MVTVAAFYKFTAFADPDSLRRPLARLACAHGVKGTVLIAAEGINGTIAGPADGVAEVLAHIRALPGCAELDIKYSTAAEMPFGRLKVRLKREIVTLGQPQADPKRQVGTYVEPADWNALIADPDVAVIDTRNAYEVAIGSFDGAVDPGTESFGEFPDWWRDHREEFTGKRIAMFCTGGIRCEKASAFLLGEGVNEVFHLKGGILRYLEEVPAKESQWHGGCFVFDDRVAVGHGLQETGHRICHACRHPLVPADLERPEFEDGVSCHRCHDRYSDADRARFRERQRQVELADARGERHLGR